MSPEAQRISIAESCGWRNLWETEVRDWRGDAPSGDGDQYIPNYLSDRNALFSALRHHGIHDPANLDIRVRYINTLREIVGRRMPKNKSGSPLTSDVDLFMAENEEIAEALLRTIKKWKP